LAVRRRINPQILLSYHRLDGVTVSTREEAKVVAFQLKVVIFSSALIIVVSGGILGFWAYMELTHRGDQQRLVDCIRRETLADGQKPAMQVVEASIMDCQD
jgi:hypothetical protein